ncbi:hypothetical protein PUNSTDRAFT_53081 [Punctularia strigosozonata HHB-11173 SS5]|uniref:uncharacterized protein n=1 Tax=Punctularia strigosozonata (strain HHB-11173) TaxID=741275 RepID=UPI0004417713|nr:uncharacterized protein PUNSTDRAFT_53081 [Punctularia strigosozonata HHB-11173 SS5]EIN07682.1 hypothetical protein PUNSTDRAFT_53081 [Punctularia strigosozonata HHB-11173 SS5]
MSAQVAVDNDYQPIPAENEAGEPLMGREEQTVKPEGRAGDGLWRTVALISVIGLTVTTWLLVIFNDPSSVGWFALHPPLQTFALAAFTLGILTLQPTSQPKTKAAGLARHQVIQLVGIAAVVMGTWFMIYNKITHGAAHFTTWHGTFGIITTVLLVAQVLIGGASVWFGGAAFGGGMKAKSVWKYHRLLGYVIYPLMLFTVYLAGEWATWVVAHTTWIVRFLAYTVAPVALLVGIYGRVRTSKMKFF